MLNINWQEEPPTCVLVVATQDAVEGFDSPAFGSAIARAARIGAAQSAAAPRTDTFSRRSRFAVAAVDPDLVRCSGGSGGTVPTPRLSTGGHCAGHRDSGRRRP